MTAKQLKAENKKLRKALDPFARAWAVSLEPFRYPHDKGAALLIPAGWPTVGDFKAAHDALSTPGTPEARGRG